MATQEVLQQVEDVLNEAMNPEEKQEVVDEIPEPKKAELEEDEELLEEEDDDLISDDEITDPEAKEAVSLNDFAADIETPMSELYGLQVKITGSENGKTIGELKDFYVENQDIESQREEVEEQREQLSREAEIVKRSPEVSAELVNAKAQLTGIERQYKTIDWEALRTQNPAEYTALQMDYRNAYEAASNTVESVSAEAADHITQIQEMEHQKLLDSMPELKDDETRKATGQLVLNLTTKYGFSQQEVSDITDSRLLRLLIDASKTVGAKETAKKKLVESKPTGTRSRGRKLTQSGKKATQSKLNRKAKESGNTDDRVAAISNLLG